MSKAQWTPVLKRSILRYTPAEAEALAEALSIRRARRLRLIRP